MTLQQVGWFAALAVLVLSSAACVPRAAAPPPAPPPMVTGETPVSARYVGVLPCADCRGIKTELTLFIGDTYHLKETYLDTRDGNRVFEQRGTWTTRRGSDRDPDATVVQLNPTTPGEVRNFVKLGDGKIKQLDGNQREIVSNLNYTLIRTDNLAPPQ